MKARIGITLVELIMSIAVFALVLTSLVSFLFTIQDAHVTQGAAHDVLAYHRELSSSVDTAIRSATVISESSTMSTASSTILFTSVDGSIHSFGLSEQGMYYTSSTEYTSLSSQRVIVDRFFVTPVYVDGVIRGVTYGLGVSSPFSDVSYRVDTTSSVYMRAQ